MASSFGERQDPINGEGAFHTGIDIDATIGTPVRAAADGEVIDAAIAGGYGREMMLDHGHDVITRLRASLCHRGASRPACHPRPGYRLCRRIGPRHRPAPALRSARPQRAGQSAQVSSASPMSRPPISIRMPLSPSANNPILHPAKGLPPGSRFYLYLEHLEMSGKAKI